MTAPQISIVIPAFNAAPFLADTLASVFAQDHRPIEVILVDDGSSDDTLACAKAWLPPLRIHHQVNAGPSAARNRGIAMAAGDYLAFIDADDLWLAGRLSRQLALLERDPALDMVLGLLQLDYRAGEAEPAARFRSDQPAIALFSFGAGLFRRRVFERVGLLSEDLRNTEDADWFMRAREAGATWLLEDQAALIYRRHGANMTERLPLAKSEVFRVLARATARKRAGAAPHDLRRLTDKPLPAAADSKAKT
jgi:glycosyltransferase involved in cell wall biosynthesis